MLLADIKLSKEESIGIVSVMVRLSYHILIIKDEERDWHNHDDVVIHRKVTVIM